MFQIDFALGGQALPANAPCSAEEAAAGTGLIWRRPSVPVQPNPPSHSALCTAAAAAATAAAAAAAATQPRSSNCIWRLPPEVILEPFD